MQTILTVSPVLTTTKLCNLYCLCVSFTLIHPLLSFHPPPHSDYLLQSGVAGRAPAVRTCMFYDMSEGFPLGNGLQRTQGFLKGKVETPSSTTHAASLPYKALKYTNTAANLTVPLLRPLKPSRTLQNKDQL